MEFNSVRVTELGMALRCPMQLWLSRVVGKKPQKAEMFVGSCLHYGVGEYLKNKAKGTVLELKDVLGIYNKEFDDKKEGVNWEWFEEGRDYARQYGESLVRTYYEGKLKSTDPLVFNGEAVVEYPVKIDIVENGVVVLTITGTVDLVNSVGIVIDHKTAQRKWAEDRGKTEIQPVLYPYGLKLKGIDVKSFLFQICVYSHKGSELQDIVVPYADNLVLKYIKFAKHIKEMMVREVPLSNTGGWWCSKKYCGWYDECEFGAGGAE